MDEHVILSLRDTVSLAANGARALTLDTSGARVTLTDLSPAMHAAWHVLAAAGATASAIASSVRSADDVIASTVMRGHLRRCDALGLLQYSVVADGHALVTIVPMMCGFYFSAAAVDADTRLRLSRFAYCRRLDDTLILESPLSTAQAILPDVLGGALVGALAQPRTCSEVRETLNESGARDALDRGAVQSCLTLLAAAGLVGIADGEGRLAEDVDPALVQWEFHDLAFHARSRLGRHDYPFGGTFPFMGQIPPLPAVAPARSTAVVELFAPDVGRLGAQDPAFSEVLERRTSVREHGRAPITAQQLGAFLFRTARVRSIRPADSSRPYEASSRPYPSGGATYDLEIYVTVHRCDGIAPGLYHYLPVEHQLEHRVGSADARAQLLRDAQSAAAAAGPPQLLITLTSRFARLSWKYRSIAYATTLKNVGVLLQTMYLVATAMDLAPCALGGGNSPAFAAAAGTSEFEESSVGEFILGSRDRL